MKPWIMAEMNRNQRMLEQLQKRRLGGKALNEKFSGPLAGLKPGNADEINRAIWPFYFPTNAAEIAPNQSLAVSSSVTQEAAFIWRQVIQTVYLKTAPNTYQYIDPYNSNEDLNKANGLKITIRDAQSTREFNGNTPLDIDLLGAPGFTKTFPSTILLLPNSTTQVILTNSHPTNTYYPIITLFGYRIRLEDARNILSTVKG